MVHESEPERVQKPKKDRVSNTAFLKFREFSDLLQILLEVSKHHLPCAYFSVLMSFLGWNPDFGFTSEGYLGELISHGRSTDKIKF